MLEIDDRIKQNPAYGNVLYDNKEDFFARQDICSITAEVFFAEKDLSEFQRGLFRIISYF